MKRRVTLGIVISIIFIYLAFRKVDYHEMVAALKSAEYIWLLPALIFLFASLLLRAIRWRYFVQPIKQIKLHPLFSAMMIGYAANNVFPLRLGEFLRAYALGKSEGISKSSAFATVIVERLLDVLSLLAILALTILFYYRQANIKNNEEIIFIQNSGYIIFALTVSIIVLMVFLMEKTESTIRVFQFFLPTKIFIIVEKIIRSFLQGFTVFKKSEHFLSIFILSISLWIIYAGILYVSFIAFNFNTKYDLNVLASLVVLVTVSIGIMIPSSPAYVGTYHYFCMKSLSLFNVPASEALSFAIISHFLSNIPLTLVGLIYFWKENLHFSDVVVEKGIIEHEIKKEEKISGKVGS
ncbi:MAG: lysylphosphatidylglycerol synthase transmembrane domain-containing protein [bacterium]